MLLAIVLVEIMLDHLEDESSRKRGPQAVASGAQCMRGIEGTTRGSRLSTECIYLLNVGRDIYITGLDYSGSTILLD